MATPLMPQNIEVTWNGVSLFTEKGEQLLADASGTIGPGNLVALMGPSGSGKTTLLNVLAGRIPTTHHLKGTILVNGKERDSKTWPNLVAYVPQRLYAHKWQTVSEILKFSATAKLSEDKSVDEEVEKQLRLLRLTGQKDTYFYQLSGGEQVRLAVALEMLGDPCILLLDEPTSGLDSANAVNLLAMLRELASQGKTIVVTIHQPSYKILQFFSNFILICSSYQVFSGTVEEGIAFFRTCGFELPKNTNPAEFFIDVLSFDESVHATNSEYLRHIKSIREKWIQKEVPRHFGPLPQPNKPRNTRMLPALFYRNLRNIIRNKALVRALLIQKLVKLLICGVTFYKLGVASADIFSLRGLFTFLIFNSLFPNVSTVLNRYSQEQPVIIRERMSGMYSGYTAYWAIVLSEVTTCFALEIPFNLLVYFLVGFSWEFDRLVAFLASICSLCAFSISYALAIGVIAGNATAAQALGASTNVIMSIYSGTFSNPRKIPPAVRWLTWVSPVSYTFRAMLYSQLKGMSVNGVPGMSVISSFGLDGISIPSNIAIVLAMTLAVQVLGAVILSKKTKNNLKIANSTTKEEFTGIHIESNEKEAEFSQ